MPNVPHTSQCGVVLIISLILLVVISLLAVTSMRNAGSSESVAGNVRRTELATEAAEIALRFCEEQVLEIIDAAFFPIDVTVPSTDPTKPIIWPPTPTTTPPTPPRWQQISPAKSPAASKWWDDSPATMAFPLPLSEMNRVNQAGVTITTYQRPPECLIEMQQPVQWANNLLTRTSSFVITARGFGPEVAKADSNRSRPQGSEVWLQSHIQIQ